MENSALQLVTRERKVGLEHISVCVCTYKRPEMLVNLLNGLINQETKNKFSYSIIIVDNDSAQSARDVVYDFMPKSKVEVEYHHEPTKGLTYARNKTLECSRGDYIAILDDDEVPAEDWLYQLYKTKIDYDADAVFGTVLPRFEVQPPKWVMNRKYFYWRDVRPETGAPSAKCVTNNVLVRRDLILQYDLKFDHDFAFTGGEDQAFFYSLLEHRRDAKLIDCSEAIVYEYFPTDRCNPDYIQKRNLLEGKGKVSGVYKFAKPKGLRLFIVFFQSYLRLLAINLLLPFLFIFNKDVGTEYYYRSYYHSGLLLSIFKFSPYEDRKSIGLQ